MAKNELENIGKEFARAITQAMLGSAKMELVDAISTYDNIEASFLPKVSEHPDLALELKRRIGERKFLLFCERNRPLEEVSLYYQAIRKLGFTDLEKKATVEMIFARYCLRNGHLKRGEKLLRKLLPELNNNFELYSHLKQKTEEILKLIEKAK